MNILAQTPLNDAAIRSTVESLKGIYAIILALAIGEAFKQFVADKAEKPEDRHIQWDRLPALLSFLLLVVPFYHGMLRYFFDVYGQPPRPPPYGLWLSVDCVAFTFEAFLFFVLSRSLPLIQWSRFYYTVMVLLGVDAGWAAVVCIAHTPTIQNWIWLDVVAFVIFAAILWLCRERQPTTSSTNTTEAKAADRHRLTVVWVLVGLILVRTAVDYWRNRSFYFPPEEPVILPKPAGKPIVYIASPYSKGDPAINTHFQCKIFDKILRDGKAWPVAPLWAHFQHTLFPRPYGDWIEYDKATLRLYDACLRLPAEVPELNYKQSESSGADGEVKYFREHDKPVFFSIADLYEWIDGGRRSGGERQGSQAATSDRRQIYFAGPLFTQGERRWNVALASALRSGNFGVILPQETAAPMLDGAVPFSPALIFHENVASIERADVVLAILDGADADSGTCFECGYAARLGRPLIGIRTDIRRGGDDPDTGVNLMLSWGCNKLISVPLAKRDDLEWVAHEISDAVRSLVPHPRALKSVH